MSAQSCKQIVQSKDDISRISGIGNSVTTLALFANDQQPPSFTNRHVGTDDLEIIRRGCASFFPTINPTVSIEGVSPSGNDDCIAVAKACGTVCLKIADASDSIDGLAKTKCAVSKYAHTDIYTSMSI